MDDLEFAPNSDPMAIVARLRLSGIVTIPRFLSAHDTARLEADHARMIERAEISGRAPDRNWIAYIERDDGRGLPYPAIQEIFHSPWLKSIASGYLGKRHSFNELIYCTHERHPLKPITDTHFDTIQSLKLFVYLMDTGERNGAVRFAAGTQIANAEAARSWRAARGRVRDTPNVASEEEAKALRSFGGPAGTLLIFDSNGFHSGGVLQSGEQRRVVRAQSYPLPRLKLWPDRFSPQWIRESRFNPLNRLARPPRSARTATGGTFRSRFMPDD